MLAIPCPRPHGSSLISCLIRVARRVAKGKHHQQMSTNNDSAKLCTYVYLNVHCELCPYFCLNVHCVSCQFQSVTWTSDVVRQMSAIQQQQQVLQQQLAQQQQEHLKKKQELNQQLQQSGAQPVDIQQHLQQLQQQHQQQQQHILTQQQQLQKQLLHQQAKLSTPQQSAPKNIKTHTPHSNFIHLARLKKLEYGLLADVSVRGHFRSSEQLIGIM